MPHRRAFLAASAAWTVTQPTHSANAQTPQTVRKLGVAMYGTKHAHAAGKLETVQRLNTLFELRGVVEPDLTQRERMANQPAYQQVNWLKPEEILHDDTIDLILVETDIDDLLPVAQRCLEAGKHIHLDKPAGTTLPSFKRVLETARKNHLQVQMGYMFRSNPAFEFALQAVKAGWLGDVFEIDAVMSKQVGTEARRTLARYQGGSMFELGCHLLDMVVAFLGEPTEIVAFNRSTLGDDLRDNCLAVLSYPKATATVRSSVVEVNGGRRRQFVLCGTQGTIEIEPLEPPNLLLTLDRPQEDEAGQTFVRGTQQVELPASPGRYHRELEKLAAAIRGEANLDYDYQHDYLVQRCVLEASGMRSP